MTSTLKLTECIQKDIPCIFVKYGDGEYAAMNHYCDGTPYSYNLCTKTKSSFEYIIKQKNAMIGAWHNPSIIEHYTRLADSPIQWVDYHTVLIDNVHSDEKMLLLKAIKESCRKKIYIANPLLKKSKLLLNIDTHIEVDYSNWFDTNFDSVFELIKNEITDDSKTMILTSAGIGAKYLIAELHKLYPNAIFVDIGSGLDTICTKRDSRGYSPPYDTLCQYLSPILPENWESSDYVSLYKEALQKLGRHLG